MHNMLVGAAQGLTGNAAHTWDLSELDRICFSLTAGIAGFLPPISLKAWQGPQALLCHQTLFQNITSHFKRTCLVLFVEKFKMQNLAEIISAVYAEVRAWALLVHDHTRLL